MRAAQRSPRTLERSDRAKGFEPSTFAWEAAAENCDFSVGRGSSARRRPQGSWHLLVREHLALLVRRLPPLPLIFQVVGLGTEFLLSARDRVSNGGKTRLGE